MQEVAIPSTPSSSIIYAASVKLGSATEAQIKSGYRMMHYNITLPAPTLNATIYGATYSIFPNISASTMAIYVLKCNAYESILVDGMNYNPAYTIKIMSEVSGSI